MRRALIALISVLVFVAGVYVVGRQQEMQSARAVQCGLAIALTAILAWTAGGWLRNILVVACSLVFGLAALEVVALATKPKPGPAGAAETDSGLGGGRPLLGWGPVKPGVYRLSKIEPDGHVIYDVKATIDENLNRKTIPSTGPGPIVFFGDSWIFGAGVADGETIPQQFADLNHGQIPVLNLSYSGWSPAVSLVALQTGLYRSLIEAPRHFILFAGTFHVERSGCRAGYRFSSAPHFVMEGGKVKYEGLCSDIGGTLLRPIIEFARGFALYDRIAPYFAEPSGQDVETFIKIIEAFAAKAKQDYGVKTTVLMPEKGDPYIHRTGYTEAKLIDRLRGSGIDVLVDALPKIADENRYWITGDGHPTGFANAARAREIEAHLEKVDPDALKVAADPHR